MNNVDVIAIEKPSAGYWRIGVVASNILQGPQDFALVWLADRDNRQSAIGKRRRPSITILT